MKDKSLLRKNLEPPGIGSRRLFLVVIERVGLSRWRSNRPLGPHPPTSRRYFLADFLLAPFLAAFFAAFFAFFFATVTPPSKGS